MTINRAVVRDLFPAPLWLEVFHQILAEHDNINRALLLDSILMCADCPPNVANADVWMRATQYVFDNNVDSSSIYIVDARLLRREYMREERARRLALLGRGARVRSVR